MPRLNPFVRCSRIALGIRLIVVARRGKAPPPARYTLLAPLAEAGSARRRAISDARIAEEIGACLAARNRTRRSQPKVTPGGWRRNSAALGAHHEALPDQERLRDLFHGFAFLADRNGQR